MLPSQILKVALEKFKLNGEKWKKGKIYGGEYCILTAIHSIAKSKFMIVGRLFKEANNINDSIIQWNDAPERTWTEIKEAFEKAIKLAKESEK